MTTQDLQIASPEDSLARLGIITNGIVIVNIVFRVCIADCRRLPVLIEGFTYLFLLHGLLGFHVHQSIPESDISPASWYPRVTPRAVRNCYRGGASEKI